LTRSASNALLSRNHLICVIIKGQIKLNGKAATERGGRWGSKVSSIRRRKG
jgi:hypothetical protein